MKRFKKTLALALAGSMCVSGMTVYAAGTAEDAGGAPVPYAVDDGLLLDFDMDSMAEGAMDDLKVYTRALSEDEIKTLAEAENQGGGEEVELPDALYEFTMDEINDGSGDLEGQNVIVNETD